MIDVEKDDLDMRWESYLNGKRDDIKRRLANNVKKHQSQPMPAQRHETETREGPVVEESRDDVRDDSISGRSKASHSGAETLQALEMFQLLEKQNWNGLARHVRSYPQTTFVRMTRSGSGLSLSSKGNLLLHEICRHSPPVALVDTVLHLNKSALKATGEHGRLPLHFACACGASGEVVQRLLKDFAAASKLRDGTDLMLPLHLACKWGANEEALKALISANADGRRVRDIYGKVPLDYAKALRSKEEREMTISCLEATNVVRTVTFKDRAALFKENTTIAELQQTNQQLLVENHETKSLQLQHAEQLKLLSNEYEALQTIQMNNQEKKSLLEKKLEVLVKANEVKQELIERLEHENNVKYNRELKKTLKGQEDRYKQMLRSEQDRVAELERRAKEIEITHRLYTNAILEEHEKEAADFEVYTLQFSELEGQLRRELEDAVEKNDFLEMEVREKGKKFDEILTSERQKVTFLEGHVSKVNDLLESEQKRFQELEDILKQTIEVENEQREELVEEFGRKEQHYTKLLNAEKRKFAALEEDYVEVRKLLQFELEKIAKFQARENELKDLVDKEQYRIQELQSAESFLEAEIQESKSMDSDTDLALAAEQEKVAVLEAKLAQVQAELEVEKKTVSDLRAMLAQKQADYDSEKKKVKALQKAQATKRQVLDSLQQKVAILEEALDESKAHADHEHSKLEAAISELDDLKNLLMKERNDVENLRASKQQVEELLATEHQKVRNLEQAQVVAEAEMQMAAGSIDENLEAKLLENQKLLTIERSRIANLKEEQDSLNKRLKFERAKLESLQKKLNVKETDLISERQKVEEIERRQAETEYLLQTQQQRAGKLERDHIETQHLLEAEQYNVQALELSLTAATNQVEMVEGRLTDLNIEETGVRSSVNGVEKANVQELQLLLNMHKSQLEAEQNLVEELELELSEARSLCATEKEKISSLEGVFNTPQDELSSEQTSVDQLQIADGIKSKSIEAEHNKVKALEHARDQLQTLLEWEKKHLKENMTKHNEVREKLRDTEQQLSSTSSALEAKTIDFDNLSQYLESLGDMKTEVIRLNTEGRKRDLLLASVLKTIEDDPKLSKDKHVLEAQVHIDQLNTILGWDLATMGEGDIVEGGALVLASPRDITTFRRIRRTLVWTIPLIPIIAISHDPSIINDITSNLDPQMLHDMTANFAAMASSFDTTMVRELTRDLANNLVNNFDPAVIQEPIAQMVSLATQLATGTTNMP